MASPVHAAIDALVPRQRCYEVVDEIQAGQGIVDLLVIGFDQEALALRKASGIGPVTRVLRVRVLDALSPSRWTSVERLAQTVGSSPKPLMRSTLGPLLELGLIELDRSRLRSAGIWRPLGERLTAVELKLNKWREAVRQADNAAWCCDHAWVVLDSGRARAATSRLDYFGCFGVGLALLGESGLAVVQRPRQRRQIRWLRSLAAELAWKRVIERS